MDHCRGKRDEQVKEHIKIIQEVYQESYYNTSQSMIINKKKQKEGVVQNKEIFLDKLYVIWAKSSKLKTPELIFIQEEVHNLEKMLKILQSPVKTIPFLSLSYYKAIWQNGEKDIQYWKEFIAEFIKQKHNSDTSQWEFPIKMYLGRSLYEPFFTTLTLWGELIIGPIKKLVVSYTFLDWTKFMRIWILK